MHGSYYGFSRPRHLSNIMKNFVRLVQFAWRYKVRFGLSVACAAMVALLFFTEIGAVYPLLHILFGSQNPQRWISEKIAGLETEILSLHAREIEARARPGRWRSRRAATRPAQRNDAETSTMILNRRRTRCANMSVGSASPT